MVIHWIREVSIAAGKKTPQRIGPLRGELGTRWGSIESLFLERLVEVFEEVFGLGELRGEEAGEFFAVRAEKDHGWESFDLVLLGERLVFLLQIFIAFRKIQLDEDELFRRSGDEFFFGKDIFAHRDARRTPVRAGEFDEHGFVFGLGLLEGFVEIGGPTFECIAKGGSGKGGDPDSK